ncbi:Retrovirus-related Pol polyprotein from transposon TNT 1-94 [Gossypium australe]|uniref:Retrovirus-related Pol polyprotein from transposon TNT 1-94 n=1 Tax=Gossypium australe TaxID=47621 RepID=A0A5B6VY49_9ROSI|nr:Retrovirus-related Pol polyprotein from transposon TNT 1-94 [Gossypium australe]
MSHQSDSLVAPYSASPQVIWPSSIFAWALPHDELVCDLHASDYSDSSGSHINTAQYRSNGDDTNSYIPMPVGTTSWYPDSGASNHVCRNTSVFRNATPYSGTSSLLMGDGTLAVILSVGNGGHIRDGLYHFPVPVVSTQSAEVPFAAHAGIQNKPAVCLVFSLWHNCLGKPHKLSFSVSTTKYAPFELIVSDLWGPASVACDNKWYYVLFINMCTQFTWIYLIRQKSQAIEYFTRFQQLIKTQFGKSIKQLQSDWGGEYRAFTLVLAS